MPADQPTLAAVVRERTGVAWSRARKLVAEGRVTVDGERRLDPAMRVSPEAVVVVNEHAPKVEKGPLQRSADYACLGNRTPRKGLNGSR